MQPPRAPLQTLSANTTSPNPLSTSKAEAAKALNGARRGQDPNKSLKLVSAEILPEFRAQIVDKTRTKIAMIEDLKERYVIGTSRCLTELIRRKCRFPKLSKETIKDSLMHYAERRGRKEGEKKWVWRDGE